MPKKEEIAFLNNRYSNWREIRFEHDNGEIYPKEVDIPRIEFIQHPEPHIIITDWYKNREEWYPIYTLIRPFAEQAFLCYNKGYWHGSIACCINCCEYILKYEYLRKIDRKDAGILVKSGNFSLGFFSKNQSKNLSKLRIRRKFRNKIKYLNNVRIGLYHFNPKKIKKINRRGKTIIEKESNPIADELAIPIVAYEVYRIMEDLINHFYNEKMKLKYIKEGLKDFRKRNENKHL